MLSSKIACEIAQRLPDVTEKDHFGGDGFYANKRIFATVWHDKQEVNVRLSPEQQQRFVRKDAAAFSQIPNGFGRMGWTCIALTAVNRVQFKEALETAWENAVSRATPKRRPKPAARATTKSPAKKRRATRA